MRIHFTALLIVISSVQLFGQTVSGRTPTVVWKRGMTVNVPAPKIADPLTDIFPAIPPAAPFRQSAARASKRRELVRSASAIRAARWSPPWASRRIR